MSVDVETIAAADGKILVYLLRTPDGFPDQTRFYTPTDALMQVGHVVYPGGSDIPRHMHLPVERHLVGSGEVLIVQRGECDLDVYDDQRTVVATRHLRPGDVVITLAGGHGFHATSDLVLMEVKQGPYPGTAEKERF